MYAHEILRYVDFPYLQEAIYGVLFLIGYSMVRQLAKEWWSERMSRTSIAYELIPFQQELIRPDARQLYEVLHTLCSRGSLLKYLIGYMPSIGLEVHATHKQGVRYVVTSPRAYAEAVKLCFLSHAPSLQLHEIPFDSRYPTNYHPEQLMVFSLKRHFGYPLNTNLPSVTEPADYMLTAMGKIDAQSLISYQVTVSGVGNWRVARARHGTQNHHVAHSTFSVSNLLRKSFRFVLFGRSRAQPLPVDLAKGESKLRLPLFEAQLKLGISGPNRQVRGRMAQMIRASMEVYTSDANQRLQSSAIKNWFTQRFDRRAFARAYVQATVGKKMIISNDELSVLYHLPIQGSTRMEAMNTSVTAELPAPLSLRNAAEAEVVLGENHYHERRTPIGLHAAERERHVYIVGGTGNGKSTMLLQAILQDMRNGKGIAVVDPHGDLVDSILRRIPEQRLKDVVYFNPDDLNYPIGLNLLEIPPDLSGTDLLRERDLVTESVISIFRKLFSNDDSGGHRVEYILRNAIQTALTIPGATLFTVYDLLNDPVYLRDVTKHLTDTRLQNFWWHELGRAGDYQRVKMTAGVTAKIGRFLFSASARLILEQSHSTINFDTIMTERKILLCNVSKGRLGDDTAVLFGTAVLAKIQIATLRRARQRPERRTPFYLYVDEFQNFATTSFVQLLSEARKYKLFLMMAEQSTAQQVEQRNLQIILANVGTLVCFRTGNPVDEKMFLPLFEPFISSGQLTNLPAYKFFIRLAAVTAQEPLTGETMPPLDKGSAAIARQAIMMSRAQYVRLPADRAVWQAPRQESRELKQTVVPYKHH